MPSIINQIYLINKFTNEIAQKTGNKILFLITALVAYQHVYSQN